MVLVKDSDIPKRSRGIRTINVVIDEPPERKEVVFRTEKDMAKFVKKCEMICRSSQEYRDYIKFIRENMDGRRCAILRNVCSVDGKKYTIEIHHEPFNLFQIVEIVIARRQIEGEPLNPYAIANEVMELHYQGMVGLIPLSITQHQLVHCGDIFIPLQKIYQDYVGFVKKYEPYIPEKIAELIEYKVQMSVKCGSFQSDVLNPEFVYVDIDGYKFPSVPDEWGIRKKALEDAIENPPDPADVSEYRPGDEYKVVNSDPNTPPTPAE